MILRGRMPILVAGGRRSLGAAHERHPPPPQRVAHPAARAGEDERRREAKPGGQGDLGEGAHGAQASSRVTEAE